MSAQSAIDLRPARFGDAGAVLLLTPPVREHDESCARLMGAGAREDVDLLQISYQRPGRIVEQWRHHADRPPGNVEVLAVGPATAAVDATPDGEHCIETVEAPSDLTGVGIAASDTLEAWSGDGRRTVVCFDSVTHLLEYVSFDTAYRFLHHLTGRIGAADATGHFHLSPEAHDDRTVERVKSLFDAVVDHTGDHPHVETR